MRRRQRARTPLGIGVSAVSHLGGEVYRNREQLDGYLECIERDESPVDGTFAIDDADRWTLLLVRTLGDGRPLARMSWVEARRRLVRGQNAENRQFQNERSSRERHAKTAEFKGGGGEIRTHGRVPPSPVFKTGALNHSATPPIGELAR